LKHWRANRWWSVLEITLWHCTRESIC